LTSSRIPQPDEARVRSRKTSAGRAGLHRYPWAVEPPEPAQVVGLRRGLHAFRHDLEAERAAEAEHGADDGTGAAVPAHRLDELAVDLQHLDRQVGQPGQRAVAGAEVVGRETHTALREAFEVLPQLDRQGVEVRLGQLQHEPVTGKGVTVEARDHLGRQQSAVELAGGDVDVDHGCERAELLGPRCRQAARLVEHPLTQAVDDVCALGDVEPGRGGQQPVTRVLPAHQGLGRDHGAGRQVDDGLDVQGELLTVQGATQLAFDARAALRSGDAVCTLRPPAVQHR